MRNAGRALLLIGVGIALGSFVQVTVFDAVVHFVTPGSLAAVLAFLLIRVDVLPDLARHPVRLRRTATLLVLVAASGRRRP